MSKFKKTNKLGPEQIFVVKGDRVAQTGSFVNASTALNINDGQLGILSWDFNSTTRALGNFLVAGDNSNQVEQIKLVMGTPKSGSTQLVDPWEVSDKAYLESGVINKANILSVSSKAASYGSYGAQALSNFGTPVDDVQYSAFLRLLGVSKDRYYGDNDEVIHGSVPVVNFTDLGTTNPKDYVLQKLAIDFNKESKATSSSNTSYKKGNRDFVVLGVKAAGGSGTALGALTVGTTLSFQIDGGVTSTIVVDAAMATALASLMNDNTQLIPASTIEVLGSVTPGSAATIDTLIVLGLPRTQAKVYDDVEQVMTTPEVNLAGGFLDMNTTVVTKARADEGTGQGSKWLIQWRNRAGLDVHTKQIQPHGDWFAEGNSYIDSSKYYTSYMIEYHGEETTLTSQEFSPQRTFILFPAEVNSTFTASVTNIATRLAASNSAFPWFTSNGANTGTISTNNIAVTNGILTVWLEHARTLNPFKVAGNGTTLA
jgi:hypothetical protein